MYGRAFFIVPSIPLLRLSGLWDLPEAEQKLPRFRSFILCAGTTGFTAMMLGCVTVGSMFLLSIPDTPPAHILARGILLAAAFLTVGIACTITVLYIHYIRPSRPMASTNEAGTSPSNIPPALRYTALVLSTGRPVSALIAGAMTTTALVAINMGILLAFIAGGAMTFTTLFGFVVNDIFDFEKDRAAQLNRPIARRDLPRKVATGGAVILAATAISLSAVIHQTVPIVAILFALVVYTPFAHKFPTLKGVYTALLCMTPVLYAASIASVTVSGGLLFGLGAFIAGRELILDVIDRESDMRWGLRTLAGIFGERGSAIHRRSIHVCRAWCGGLVWEGAGCASLCSCRYLQSRIFLPGCAVRHCRDALNSHE